MSKSVTVRLDDGLLAWADEYAGERGVSRTQILEAALGSFREDASRGVPDLPQPAPKLRPGECPVVEVAGPGVDGDCPEYGAPVEPPGDSKFVCPRGDCGWSGASKVELCPEHGRWAVPRGSSSRRVIVALPLERSVTRQDFVRRTGMRGEAFSRARLGAGVVVGGSSESRDESNRARQDVLNKAKGMD